MDIDLMEANVFGIRSRTDEDEIGMHFDNIVFVANALDALAGDDRFIEIRKRSPSTARSTTIDNKVRKYREEVADLREKDDQEIQGPAQRGRRGRRQDRTRIPGPASESRRLAARRSGHSRGAAGSNRSGHGGKRRRAAASQERARQALEHDHQRNLEMLDRQLNTNVREEQNWYKSLAVLFPPIPPIIVAAFVFFSRRAQEREGVASSRLR